MLCIIRKGTRMKVLIASPNSMFFKNELVSGGWQLRQNKRGRKFPAKRKSKLFPFVMIVDLGTNHIKEWGDDVSTSGTSISHLDLSGKFLTSRYVTY
ncbi:hypothetical protein GQ457_04G020070 [Hibiscus cannabinus]